MSETTNLKLFKHDNPETNENQFDVQNALNNNWDKIDEFAGKANDTVVEIQDDVEELQGDNETNKQDIANLKTENEELKAENERLRQDMNAYPSNTASGEYITLNDSADSRFNKFKIKGNSIQNGEPTPENLIEIQNVKGKTTIKITNENLANINEIYNNMKAFDSNSCSETVVDGIECIEFNNTSYQTINNFNLIDYNYKVNTAYTIRGKFKKKNESDTVRLYIQVIYTDGTQDLVNSADNDWFELRIVTNSSKTIKNIGFSYSNGGYYYLNKSSIFIGEGNVNNYIINEQQEFIFPLSEGQILMEGDYPADDGIHHKRKQIILDGTENWLKDNNAFNYFYMYFSDMDKNKVDNIICSHFTKGSQTKQGFWTTSVFAITIDAEYIGIQTGDNADVRIEKFKNWLKEQKEAGTSVTVEYELLEEETEAYTDEQKQVYDEIVKTAKTYKTVTNIFSTNEISPKFEVEYRQDVKAYIDNKLANVQAQTNTINELLSTTKTSATLLDNLQSDLEREVK